MTKDEALKLALEALDHLITEFRIHDLPYGSKAYAKGTNAIREIQAVLAQPEQEPWVCECGADSYLACKCAIKSPPQRKPLTNEEERKAFVDWCFSVGLMAQSHGLRSESSDCDTAWKAWKARAAHGIIAPTELKGEA